MTRILSGFMLLAIFAFSASFYQQFYIPKIIVFYALAIACLAFLATRRQLFLPGTKVLLFLACFLLIAEISSASTNAPLTAFMQWSFYFAGALLFIVLINLEHPAHATLLKVVFAAALAQLALLIPQFLSLHGMLPAPLLGQHERIYGTVGNQEFLATLLGVGFFIGLHFQGQAENRQQRNRLIVANAMLLLGMMLTQNKGGLLFIVLYFLWKRFPNYKLLIGLVVLALSVATFAFPASINGRLLLWLAASSMIMQNVVQGVGPLQFENHYLDVVHHLFSAHPALSEKFGSYTAAAMDTHNIFLQFGVMFGIAGLLLSLILVGYALRLVNDNRNYLGAALLFLLFKSLYTVMLSSITGMILFVLLLAILSQKQVYKLDGRLRNAALVSAPVVAMLFVYAITLSASDYFFQQGARALFMGQHEQAEASLHRALYLNQENVDACLGLAQASYVKGDYAGMRTHIKHALSFRKNKDTLKIAASMFFYAKRYDDAYAIYQFLHAAFPQHLTSMTKLATIYIIRHEYDKAYAMAQAVLHTVPRKHAESDEKNIRIARQIAADSNSFISHSEIVKEPRSLAINH